MNNNNKYNEKLTPIQIAFRDFIKEYDLTWSFWLTLRYNYKPTETKVRKDVNLIQRHIGKTLKTQVLYFGIYVRAMFNNFSHVHLLIHTKKSYDWNLFDTYLLTTTVKDFYLKNIFPFKHYDLKIINQMDYFKSIERISQYIVKKDHMDDGSYFLITSAPKKLNKYKRSD